MSDRMMKRWWQNHRVGSFLFLMMQACTISMKNLESVRLQRAQTVSCKRVC